MNKESFGYKTWKRLKRNRPAMLGAWFIVLSVLVAIGCYLAMPDATPNANRMMLEISARKPGFKMTFLKLDKPRVQQVPWYEGWFNGRPDQYTYLPITGYQLVGDTLIVQHFLDETTSDEQRLALTEVVRNPAGIADMGQYIAKERIEKKTFVMGTDKYGRDMLSRLLLGTRISLSVGIIAVLISLTIGILFGALAGYFGGWPDKIIMWLINTIWAIPTLLLVFAITIALGKGFWQIFIAVGLTMWVGPARLIRGQVMGIKELGYIDAARALGYNHLRIIFRHILPNIIGPVLVLAASNFAVAILIEAGLSFLGIGVQPPQASWGLMIKENYNFIITDNPMLALIPGLAIMLMVLAFNLLANGLRDAVDVRSVD
jgi:peptide/nickel transport system permease protein